MGEGKTTVRGVWGGLAHTALFKMDHQQGPTIGNSAPRYRAAWMQGAFEEEWIHVYVWLSPFLVSPVTIMTLLIGSTPIQNKKFKIKF